MNKDNLILIFYLIFIFSCYVAGVLQSLGELNPNKWDFILRLMVGMFMTVGALLASCFLVYRKFIK